MDCIGFFGYLGIFVFLALFGFTVMCVPLFYTVITRWAFSGGKPVTEFPPELSSAAPVPVATHDAVESESGSGGDAPAPTDAVVDVDKAGG